MSELIYECTRCGTQAPIKEWERPGTNEFKCPNCSYKVAKKIRPPIAKRVKAKIADIVVEFTKEYRDRHWIACRYHVDPRNCGSKGRVTDCFARKRDGELHNYCQRDDKLCDAKWEE